MGKHTQKLMKLALEQGLRVDELLKNTMLDSIIPYEPQEIHLGKLPKRSRQKKGSKAED